MEMDLEGKIRSRIEAILLNDARNYAEIKMVAAEEDSLEIDPFAEERNLYQRIISTYRSASSEVNSLLEENVGCLSGLYRVAETIKETDSFQDICLQIVDCVLQDFGAEYCALVFCTSQEPGDELSYFEGIREERKFQCCHSRATLLGSPEFDRVIRRLAHEATECLNIGDVYREPRFNRIDFPSVVRSLVFLPFQVRQTRVGALILSHSLPRFFTQNHARVLKILSSTIAHIWLLTAGRESPAGTLLAIPPKPPAAEEESEAVSIVLLDFESDGSGRGLLADRETIRNIRTFLCRCLETKESILLYDAAELLVLLPGTTAEQILGRLQTLRLAFDEWRADRGERASGIRINFGYSTCESGEDLVRTLEVASMMTRTEQDENDPHAAGQSS